MRVIVCGGRDYFDLNAAFKALDRFEREHGKISRLAHGRAPGADACAASWAIYRSREMTAYPADWKRHGKAAGPRRNQDMLDTEQPDAVIAFPGGKGTADMIRRAKAAGVPVHKITSPGGSP